MFNWNIKQKPFMSLLGMGGGSASPGNFSTGGGALYEFSSFTFTKGGGAGKFGTDLNGFLNSYDTTTYSWLNDTSFYASPQPGFQLWTVPEDGDYTIEVKGASGGSVSYPGTPNNFFNAQGGGGATLKGTFSLTGGDKVLIAVGQHGNPYSAHPSGGGAGGGGGSFVLAENASANSDIYVIAGGGGGASYWPGRMSPTADQDGQPAPANTTSGGRAQPQNVSPLNGYGQIAPGPGGGARTIGGTNGYGGGGGVGGGGAGYFGPGGGGNGTTSQDGRNGHSYTVTGTITPTNYRLRGGDSQYTPSQGDGGFGGGGGSQVTTGYGGGGGGYSGGGGGTFTGSRQQNGGYGGSYMNPSATNVVRTNGTTSPSNTQGIDGSVIITKV